MQRKGLMRLWVLFVLAATAMMTLNGCSGSNGATGPAGKDANGTVSATTMTVDELANLKLSSTNSSVTGVTINSPPVVTFTIRDVNNRGVTGLGYTTINSTTGLAGLSNLGFTIAKLVPGTNGSPNKWVNYIVWSLPYKTTAAAPGRPTTDNNGTLVDNGDGSYTYTFARDIKLAKSILDAATYSGNNIKADLDDVTYEPGLQHRLVVQIGGTVRGTGSNNSNGTDVATGVTAVNMANPINLIYDFIPSTGAVVKAADAQREIVQIEKCNECHGKLAFHGGNVRVEAKYCVTCHTDQRKYGRAEATTTATGYNGASKIHGAASDINTYKINNQAQGDFVTMVHRIHMSSRLTKTGYNYAGVLFDKGGYPQDPGLCRKCHDGDITTNPKAPPQGNNWRTKPSRLACGTCHDGVNFATGAGHSTDNLAQLNDSACVTCHNDKDANTAFSIESSHRQTNKTTNNPTLATGLKHITYELKSATVLNDATTIVFRINVDGTPMTLPTSDFTSGPSFLLAYSMPQEGSSVASPDFNNLGRAAAQPISVSLANIISGTSGTLSGPDSTGYYTAVIPAGANSFPANSKYRTVALQGTYTQKVSATLAVATARPAVSVQIAVTGDDVRRKVVDPNKCGSCHEWFVGHGGSRVFETQVCVMCHVPNLSSSGKGIVPTFATNYVLTALETALLATWTDSTKAGIDPPFPYIAAFDKNVPSTYPEAPQNFKDMIHGVHAGSVRFNGESKRNNGMQFVRDRGTVIVYFDSSKFKFPNKLGNCESCHVPGTYATSKIPAGALQSNNWTTTDATTPTPAALDSAGVIAARASLPNNNDRVTSPITASCVSCHDSALAKAHMTTNGGKINGLRTATYFEQCNLCHGDGSDFDPAKVHNK